jgi:predicted alpha/beta hydrolase
MMTLRGTHSLLGLYENAPSQVGRIGPLELGVPRLGHFGPFRSEFEVTLWPRMDQWLGALAPAKTA